MTPSPWAFALLSLAGFRCWWLLSQDAILNRWRERIFGRWPGLLTEFASCAWCAGAWLTVAWWTAWYIEPHWTLVVAVPFALSATVGIIAAVLPD